MVTNDATPRHQQHVAQRPRVHAFFGRLLIFSFCGLVMCETFIFGLNFEETEDMHRVMQFFVTKLENYQVFANDPADLMQPGGEHFGVVWAHVQTILASTAVSTNGIRAWAIMVADLLTGGTGLTPTDQGTATLCTFQTASRWISGRRRCTWPCTA